MATITFNKYMDNPGEGTSAIGNRNMIKNFYKQKFSELMVREQGKVDFKIYKTDNSKDAYIIHFKIPSEKLLNYYYDVVVELFTTDNNLKQAANLRGYFVRFFSNDASFIYTYCRAFSLKGYFINELKQKMLPRVFSEPSKVRNPKNEIWYVKSLCFAYYTMEKYGMFNRSMLNQYASKFSLSDLLNHIPSTESKIEERRKLEEEIRLKKNAQKKTQAKQPILPAKFGNKAAKTIYNTKTTKKTGNIRVSKTTRSVNKI